ncbi:hypothetical protein Hanom_Chr07g00626931 [Helianthus anomalus]
MVQMEKVVGVEKPTEAEKTATVEVENPVQAAEKPAREVRREAGDVGKDTGAEVLQAQSAGGEGVSSFCMQHKKPSPIHPKDTLGDHYYCSYDDSRAGEGHILVWKLKQGDTFPPSRHAENGLLGPFPLLRSCTRKRVNTSRCINRTWSRRLIRFRLATKLCGNDTPCIKMC